MELCSGLHVIDDVLSSEELQQFKEIVLAHTYTDTLDFFSFFMPDMAPDYRIFKNSKNTLTDSKNLSESKYESVHNIIETARCVFKYDSGVPTTSQVTIMPNSSEYSLHIDSSYLGAFVYYLNEEWTIENEGELICYPALNTKHEDFINANFGKP